MTATGANPSIGAHHAGLKSPPPGPVAMKIETLLLALSLFLMGMAGKL